MICDAARRFLLFGLVVALVALLSTVLSGLVTDGISGLRALPADRLVFEDGAAATFSRSTLDDAIVEKFAALAGVEATPLGASFVNAASAEGGPILGLAILGVTPDSWLLPEATCEALTGVEVGMIVDEEVADKGVEVGDLYRLGGSGVELPVLGFTSSGTYGHAPIAFVPLDAWQQVQYGTQPDGRFSAVALRGPGGTIDASDAAADLEVLTKTQAYAGSPGYSAETTTMTLIRSFLPVISALVAGAFFTVLMVQRTRQIGLLKAMGASNGYTARDAIGQMTILVAIATVAVLLIAAGVLGSLTANLLPSLTAIEQLQLVSHPRPAPLGHPCPGARPAGGTGPRRSGRPAPRPALRWRTPAGGHRPSPHRGVRRAHRR